MLKYEYETTSCNGINGTFKGDHINHVFNGRGFMPQLSFKLVNYYKRD